MIIDDVENNTHTSFMACINQLLEFGDACVRIGGIGRIPSFRRKIVVRIISPVIIITGCRTTAFIRTVRLISVVPVQNWQQFNMGYTERL